MPKKTVVIDYQACDPKNCKRGVCRATLVCKKRVLTQEAPYEMPDANVSMCLSCALCTQACPVSAVYMM